MPRRAGEIRIVEVAVKTQLVRTIDGSRSGQFYWGICETESGSRICGKSAPATPPAQCAAQDYRKLR
jgi:hypothetical protein